MPEISQGALSESGEIFEDKERSPPFGASEQICARAARKIYSEAAEAVAVDLTLVPDINAVNQLFASYPRERWKNTQEWLKNQGKQPGRCDEIARDIWSGIASKWPKSCSGSINAWLIVVGASPGSSPPARGFGSDDEMRDYRPVIGCPHPRVARGNDARHYWDRVREIAERFFSVFSLDQYAALSLLQHVNLLTESSGTQPRIEMLRTGGLRTRMVFRETHPRCIVALTKDVLKVVDASTSIKHKVIASGELNFGQYNPKWMVLKTENNSIVLARTPNHPSRHGFKYLGDFAETLARIVKRELQIPD